MTFTKPTTLNEMYSTLNDIFYYYRIKKVEFKKETLYPLVLTRLQFSPLSDESLLIKAGQIVESEQLIEIGKLRLSLGQDIDELNDKINQLTKAYNLTIEKIVQNYNVAVKKIQDDAIKRGVGLTTVVASELAKLEEKKNQDLSQAEQDYQAESGFYQEKITQLTNRYNNANLEYSQIFESQKQKKFIELKDEQDKLVREIFKYNNSLDEKEQRSINSIAQSNATLQLKYLEISANNLSKDQLIDMGYYSDVIDCVCGYYDTLDALTAWKNISADEKVAIYLEEYYTQIVYMYYNRYESSQH